MRQNLIKDKNGIIDLTSEGKKLVEVSYYHNIYTSHYMRIFLSEKTVMLGTALFLIIISLLKILIGMQLGSQAMLTEGFENFTDLIKIGIVGLIGIKLKKDKFASVIIICLMMFTGVTLVWSGIEALIYLSPIIPTVEAYIIGIVSIALNAGLGFLKSMVGRASGNLSLLSDSKDSLLNVRISVGVLIGLTFAVFKIYFVDAIIGIVIATFVSKEGIEVLREILSKDKEFDITAIKVFADTIYNNRLTAYILGSVRREKLTVKELIENFEMGLTLGRHYYEGFADFFYSNLGSKTAEKYITELINGDYLEIIENELFLTKKGLKAFYQAKAKEFRGRSQNISVRSKFKLRDVYCIIVIILLLMLVIFGPQINLWINNLW
jgi:Co/Zn/Cd efflux system component